MDLKELLDDTTPYQAGELFHRFYRDAAGYESEEIDKLQDKLRQCIEDQLRVGRPISMAALQGHFIRYGPAEALAHFDLLIEQSQRESSRKSVTPSMPS